MRRVHSALPRASRLTQGKLLLSKQMGSECIACISMRPEGSCSQKNPNMNLDRTTQHTHLDPLNCTLHRPVTWSTSVTLPSLVRRVPFMALRTATPRMSSADKYLFSDTNCCYGTTWPAICLSPIWG